jgi:hypothetical protein
MEPIIQARNRLLRDFGAGRERREMEMEPLCHAAENDNPDPTPEEERWLCRERSSSWEKSTS